MNTETIFIIGISVIISLLLHAICTGVYLLSFKKFPTFKKEKLLGTSLGMIVFGLIGTTFLIFCFWKILDAYVIIYTAMCFGIVFILKGMTYQEEAVPKLFWALHTERIADECNYADFEMSCAEKESIEAIRSRGKFMSTFGFVIFGIGLIYLL